VNILFFITDQQSHNALSCAGHPHLNTPHMDALATSGVRFTESYCAAPVCGPSRACLATGRMPHENGVLVNGLSIPDEMPTMGELFRDASYRTGWTGRWCVPGNGPDIRGFECLHDSDQPLGQGIYTDTHVADRAIDFLDQKHDRPFLLGVSLCNPHDICYWVMQQSTPQGELDPHTIRLKETADALAFASDADESELPPLPDNFAIDPNEPSFVQSCRQRPYYGQEVTFTWDWDETTWRRYLFTYHRLTELVDIQVGRVMSALHENGLSDNTLILLTSDHGEGQAAHHTVVKLWLNEEAARVPMIVSGPGIPADVVNSDHLTSGIDILPTMCDYTEVDCPDVTGRSLLPVIDDPTSDWRGCVVSELHPDPKNLEMQARMVRSQRYKYVVYSMGTNPEQLFDLDADPGETANLALDASRTNHVAYHRDLLREWLSSTGDAFTVPTTP